MPIYAISLSKAQMSEYCFRSNTIHLTQEDLANNRFYTEIYQDGKEKRKNTRRCCGLLQGLFCCYASTLCNWFCAIPTFILSCLSMEDAIKVSLKTVDASLTTHYINRPIPSANIVGAFPDTLQEVFRNPRETVASADIEKKKLLLNLALKTTDISVAMECADEELFIPCTNRLVEQATKDNVLIKDLFGSELFLASTSMPERFLFKRNAGFNGKLSADNTILYIISETPTTAMSLLNDFAIKPSVEHNSIECFEKLPHALDEWIGENVQPNVINHFN